MDERGISRRQFIRLGAVLGLGSVGAPMATGCGADVGSSETQASPTADAPEVGKGQAFAKESEVGRLLLKDSARARTPALSGTNLGGLTAGIAVMYVTALLVTV